VRTPHSARCSGNDRYLAFQSAHFRLSNKRILPIISLVNCAVKLEKGKG
jgi:hypothetical protein